MSLCYYSCQKKKKTNLFPYSTYVRKFEMQIRTRVIVTVVCLSCFTAHVMHRSKCFKKITEFRFIHSAGAEMEPVQFSWHCEPAHSKAAIRGLMLGASAQHRSPAVTRAKVVTQPPGSKLTSKSGLKTDSFEPSFRSPKPVLHSRRQRTHQQTDVQPARGSGAGQGRLSVCAVAEL